MYSYVLIEKNYTPSLNHVVKLFNHKNLRKEDIQEKKTYFCQMLHSNMKGCPSFQEIPLRTD